jgi:hypothetical protein
MNKLLFQLGRHLRSIIRRFRVALRVRRIVRCAGRVFITLLAFSGSEVQATTTYYSTGSADVNTLTHWNTSRDGTGTSPADFASGDAFVIQNGHSMTTTAAWSVSGTGNGIQVESGGTLTATWIAATSTFRVGSGGTYVHNAASGSANGAASDIPGSTSRDFGASSTIEIQKWANGGPAPVALPSGVAWGNLKINVASLGGNWQQSGGLTTVNGSLTIASTGTTSLVLSAYPGPGYTLTIVGDLNISGGTLDMLNSYNSIANQINLGGNFNQTGGTFTRTSTSDSPTGTFLFTGGSSSVTFSQAAGTFTATRINITVDTGKTVTLNNNLNTGDYYKRQFTVAGSLLCGTKILSGLAQFFLNAGGTLGIGDPNGIASGTTASGNIQTTSSLSLARNFSRAANYIYNGIAAQVTGSGLPTTVANLTINNANGVSLMGDVSVNGTLTFTGGKLKTSSYILSLGTAATVSGAGSSTGWVVGNLCKTFDVGQNQSFRFELGDDAASSYTPAALASMGVGKAGALTATVTASSEPNLASGSGISGARHVRRYWTITPSGGFALGGASPTYGITVTFLNPGDLQGSANPLNFILRKDNNGTWTAASDGPATATTTTGVGFGSLSSFAVGEPSCTPAGATVRSADATTICSGQSQTIHADLTGQGPWTVVWSDGTTTTTHSGVGGTGTVGTDSITISPLSTTFYTVTSVFDAGGCASVAGTGSAQVTVNAAPAGGADTLSTPTNTAATISSAKLKANDTGTGLSLTAVSNPSAQGGTVSLSGVDGSVKYTPKTDYGGSDSFTYTLSNDQGCTVQVPVTVTVGPGSSGSANVLFTGTVNGSFVVRFAGFPGETYTVECTDSLPPGISWAKLGSANYKAPASGDSHPYGIGVFEVTDPLGSSSRYYRTVWPAY